MAPIRWQFPVPPSFIRQRPSFKLSHHCFYKKHFPYKLDTPNFLSNLSSFQSNLSSFHQPNHLSVSCSITSTEFFPTNHHFTCMHWEHTLRSPRDPILHTIYCQSLVFSIASISNFLIQFCGILSHTYSIVDYTCSWFFERFFLFFWNTLT
jgi:hypothetical protein